MKYDMPDNHGLSKSVFQNLVFKEAGRPTLSDVQFSALKAGVGRGESLLVVSPTSTGKTQIALWAIAKSLESGHHTVYLVTHRALAKQKFEDFKSQLLNNYLDGDAASLVVATGDYVEDADEQPPADPLRAPLLVATYEKYLALLSACLALRVGYDADAISVFLAGRPSVRVRNDMNVAFLAHGKSPLTG